MSNHELIGMVLGIVIFGTILMAASWPGGADPAPRQPQLSWPSVDQPTIPGVLG